MDGWALFELALDGWALFEYALVGWALDESALVGFRFLRAVQDQRPTSPLGMHRLSNKNPTQPFLTYPTISLGKTNNEKTQEEARLQAIKIKKILQNFKQIEEFDLNTTFYDQNLKPSGIRTRASLRAPRSRLILCAPRAPRRGKRRGPNEFSPKRWRRDSTWGTPSRTQAKALGPSELPLGQPPGLPCYFIHRNCLTNHRNLTLRKVKARKRKNEPSFLPSQKTSPCT
ncbi:hypothetical protein LguiB_031253 [Lonicera macranthoides]